MQVCVFFGPYTTSHKAAAVTAVVSVCNGAFILAKTGLLDGLSATTFYDLIDEFETRYPKVKAVRDRRFADSQRIRPIRRILCDGELLPPEGRDLRRPCLWTFALLLVAASAAHSDCPSSCITILSGPAVCSSQPSDSASAGSPGSPGGTCSAAYDVFAGTIRASSKADCSYGWALATVDMREEYRIEGMPPGTPVSLEVRLRIEGGLCFTGCYSLGGSATGRLAHGAAFVTVQIPYCSPVVRTLQLPVTILAGDPFTIEATVDARIFSGTSDVDGVLSFHGLPEDARVVLCRSRVTPATTSSWGRVKAMYR